MWSTTLPTEPNHNLIKTAHQKLIEAGYSATKLKLLILAEQGKIYHFLKKKKDLEGGAKSTNNSTYASYALTS